MIRGLMQKLGLDPIGDFLSAELRRVKIEVLQEERKVVQSLLDRIEDRIASLGGVKRAKMAAGKKPRRRQARLAPRPGETLRDMVAKALAKAGGPVKVTTLVDLVLEAGYKTNAKRSTLVTSTYTVLADTKVFRRLGKGVFGLRVAPTTARKAMKQAISPNAPEPKMREKPRKKTVRPKRRKAAATRKPRTADVARDEPRTVIARRPAPALADLTNRSEVVAVQGSEWSPADEYLMDGRD